MDPSTVLKVVKTGAKAAKAVASYIDKDLHTYYGLKEPAWAKFSGKGVGVIGRAPKEVWEASVGVLHIVFLDPDSVRLSASPFLPSLKLWNGPNGIPDDLGDGSFEMSLWHDLLWAYAKRLAEILGVTEQDVMKWADGILYAAYKGYGEARGRDSRLRAWLAYNVVERARKWWRKIFPAATCLAVALALAGCSGCLSPPPWELDESSKIEVAEDAGEAVQSTAETEEPGNGA